MNLKFPWQERKEGSKEVIWRYDNNPIVNQNPTSDIARVFNSAVVKYNEGYACVFRGDHRDSKAMLHVGFSEDGINFNINNDPIIWFDENGMEYQPFYAYDPRVVKIDDIYYITWCTEFGGPAIGLGTTKDFKKFTRKENALMPYNRNGVLFPNKINGTYRLLSRPSDAGHTAFGDIFVSESKDLVYYGKHKRVMTKGGSGWWQELKIGAGPVPILTSEGWLLIYHGVTRTCNGYVYSMGGAILDENEPSIVKYRTKDYLLTPEENYERVGFVPNVVFPCAMLHDESTNRLAIYYGAADTYVALAFAYLDELVEHIKNNHEHIAYDDVPFR